MDPDHCRLFPCTNTPRNAIYVLCFPPSSSSPLPASHPNFVSVLFCSPDVPLILSVLTLILLHLFSHETKCVPFLLFLMLNSLPNHAKWIWQMFLTGGFVETDICNRVDLIFSLLIPLFVSQDSSEAANLRQPYGHPGGFPVDGGACQGGDGPAALLHPHYDQNCLHQL